MSLDLTANRTQLNSNNKEASSNSSPNSDEPAPVPIQDRFTRVSSVSLQSIFGADAADVFVTGLAADRSTRTMFLSFYSVSPVLRGGVHTLELSGVVEPTTALKSRDAYICQSGRGCGVCFEHSTGTLLACTYEKVDGRLGHWLVAFSRSTEGGQFIVEHRIQLEPTSGDVRFADLNDARVLFSESYSTQLQVLHISHNNHCIERVGSVRTDQQFSTFDARTIGNETLVVFISKYGSHIKLGRLLTDYTLQEYCSLQLADTWKIMWFGQSLLLSQFDSDSQTDSLQEAFHSGNILRTGPSLLNERNIIKWCDAGGLMGIIDYVIQELCIYAVK